jgi:hypothetical protein
MDDKAINMRVTAWSRSPLLEVLRSSRFPKEPEKTSELLPPTRQIAPWLIVET